MSKANEPAYPVTANISDRTGLTKKEKLAMDLYARKVVSKDRIKESQLKEWASDAIFAADIFFEQLNK